MEYPLEYPLEIGLSSVFVIVFSIFPFVLKFPEGSLKNLCAGWLFLALVSQVLSFYSLHILFFSPGISKDQCPQREQQTFPQDWEYYGVSSGVSSGDMFVISVCHCFFHFPFVLKFPEGSLKSFCA